jgi:TRAP-type C4-dicarboxylate transport system substrate-binding protein
MWMWEGDDLAKMMYEAMGVTPVSLSVTDVLTSLQTNLIDGVYNTELGAIAFQWQTKVTNLTDLNLVNGTGAILITKDDWNKLEAGQKTIVQKIVEDSSRKLVLQTRSENLTSKQMLAQNGVKIVTPDPKDVAELQTIGLDVRQKLVGKLYSQQLLDQVLALLK